MSDVTVSVWVRPADLHLVNAGREFEGWSIPGTQSVIEVHVPVERVEAVAPAGRVLVRAVYTPSAAPLDAYAVDLRSRLAIDHLQKSALESGDEWLFAFVRAVLLQRPVDAHRIWLLMREVLTESNQYRRNELIQQRSAIIAGWIE